MAKNIVRTYQPIYWILEFPLMSHYNGEYRSSSPFSYGFLMVSLWFSHDFPMIHPSTEKNEINRRLSRGFRGFPKPRFQRSEAFGTMGWEMDRLPSGNDSQFAVENHHFSWENPPILRQFSIAVKLPAGKWDSRKLLGPLANGYCMEPLASG